MDNRIKGQDTLVQIVQNGQLVSTITDVRSFEMTLRLHSVEETYLGESKPRFDELHGGYAGRIEFHHNDPDVWDFFSVILKRASQRAPGTRVNIQSTLQYPDGRRLRIMWVDCNFSDIPITLGARSEYGSTVLTFTASEGITMVA